MKYCLSSRQTKKYLIQADEIRVESRDYRQISDLFVEYPDKMIILEIDNDNLNDTNYMGVVEQYAQSSENFCCCIYNLKEAIWFKERNIKFYYGYPINDFYDLQALKQLGVEYIKLIAPLTFHMQWLEKQNVKFRMVPNVAYDAYIPRVDGICGQWVRPEDVKWYDAGIYVFEFEDANLEKERALYDTYAIQKKWEGNLYFLITNLNKHIHNNGLPDDFGQIRSNCGQKCMKTEICHYCKRAFDFAKILKKNKEQIKEQIINHKKK